MAVLVVVVDVAIHAIVVRIVTVAVVVMVVWLGHERAFSWIMRVGLAWLVLLGVLVVLSLLWRFVVFLWA